jgi:hypothetical protein
MTLKLYFAHAMCVYGTDDEKRELAFIRTHYQEAEIIDPGSYEDHPEKTKDSMAFCYKLLDGCQIMIFTRCLDKVTVGVGQEIIYALQKGIKVFELDREGKLIKITEPVAFIDRLETRSLYREYFIESLRTLKRKQAVRIFFFGSRVSLRDSEMYRDHSSGQA